MIPRYARKDMTAIWSEQNKFQIWCEIEVLVCEALANIGQIPAAVATRMRKNVPQHFYHVDVEAICAIEAETHHDVIAFLTYLTQFLGKDSRFMHMGMTSSDVLDTCLSVQLVQATDILLAELDRLLNALKDKAFAHRNTLCIGRSHGIHAEPTTFGLKMAYAYAEFHRHKIRLEQARESIAVCTISGAIGTYAYIDPEVEKYVAHKLGLLPEMIATQVIARDRHAHFFNVLALIASSNERLAVEIRHLQRTEVGEVYEPFGSAQKGSSAMPHKRNPVLSENITGLSRLIRSYAHPAMENIVLWHERDISHSSVERVIAPDATIALDFSLDRMTGVIENLNVNVQGMEANMAASRGLFFSPLFVFLSPFFRPLLVFLSPFFRPLFVFLFPFL
jgi:adenylosuccinate lyase